MTDIGDLLKLIDAYQLATGLTDSSLSTYVFNDGKKVSRLRGGKDINVSRFNAAFKWFSENWPSNEPWPKGIIRPNQTERAA